MTLPLLAGRRVLVTRAMRQAGKLSEGLHALGAVPVEVPVLEIRPPGDLEPLDAALHQLSSYHWLILTSANTVRVLTERAAVLGVSFDSLSSVGIAVVGEATAAEARKSGFSVTLVPESYVAESLVQALTKGISGKRVLLARAAVARDIIPDSLRAAGAELDVVDAYRTVLPDAAPEQLRKALADGSVDAATFTSSSTAIHLAEAAHRAGIDFPLPNVPAISIGPITSQTLVDLGWAPTTEAALSDIPGLIAAVVRVLAAQ